MYNERNNQHNCQGPKCGPQSGNPFASFNPQKSNNMYNQNNPQQGCTRGPQQGGHPFFAKYGKPGFSGRQPGFAGTRRPKYNVPVNITETDTEFTVQVYATGFAKENIKISLVDDVLHITGTKEIDENNLPNFTRQEFPIKNFERTMSLDETIDKTAITAKQVEGVLVITLPKTAEAKAPAQEITVA